MTVSTPHNAAKRGDIAKTILLPGDPLRAKFVAENFLENAVIFNAVRNMLGFTGTYRGVSVSVMGTGMGIPSMAIYSHELIHDYGVKNLIRIGTAGGYSERVKLGDLVFAQYVSTDSNFAAQFELCGATVSAGASYDLLARAKCIADDKGVRNVVGHVKSSDIFYEQSDKNRLMWTKLGVDAVEMESYALYLNAMLGRVNALTIVQISDHLLTGEAMSSDERQTGLSDMIGVALDLAKSIN